MTCHRQCDIAVQECDDKIRGQHALTSQSDKVTMPHTETCTTPMSDSHLEPPLFDSAGRTKMIEHQLINE